MTPLELFRAGKLADALAASTELVKRAPASVPERSLLAQLLCFSGEFARADMHFDLISRQDPKVATGVALLRQLLRAAGIRQQCFFQGRSPEYLAPPTPALTSCLQAVLALRESRAADAAALANAAEETRVPLPGLCDGEPFADWRDLDDLTAGFFEVMTSTGRYFWVPASSVRRIEFKPPDTLWGLLWRQASMIVANGPTGDVFIPALYAAEPSSAAPEAGEDARLGRLTDWLAEDGAPVRGIGLRSFLVGEDEKTIAEIGTVTFGSVAETVDGAA